MVITAGFTTACEEGPPLNQVPTPPDAGCTIPQDPQNYEVYFVLDVSGSMEPYLQEVNLALGAFAASFPERDLQDRPVTVQYYVVGFVNDFVWFPSEAERRMTSPSEVQQAFNAAIASGRNNTLIERNIINAEPEENLLDALGLVLDNPPSSTARVLVLIATDANFVEAPTRLSGDIIVQASYEETKDALALFDARIHAFTAGPVDGLTRTFRGVPALTDRPGSATYSLRNLSETEGLIQATLTEIVRGATCQF